MNCTRCGNEIEGTPAWAKYADKAFQSRVDWNQPAFPLHEKCFEVAEYIDVAEWETDKDGNAVLVDKGQQRRYRRVKNADS